MTESNNNLGDFWRGMASQRKGKRKMMASNAPKKVAKREKTRLRAWDTVQSAM